MKIFAPDYYKRFKCIADKCKHSCCVGWEIDIDEDTFKYYKEIKGDFGERLKRGICEDENAPYFILADGERCPFLNKHKLCDIIINLGEEGLCQICADHPRFRSFFADRTEIGLGLCCEAAGELILTNCDKVKIIEIEDDGEEEFYDTNEKEFFVFRNKLFDILQNREMGIEERVSAMLEASGAEFPKKSFLRWAQILRGLERLDNEWDKMIDTLSKAGEIKAEPDKKWDIAYEQAAYIFYLPPHGRGDIRRTLKRAGVLCGLWLLYYTGDV